MLRSVARLSRRARTIAAQVALHERDAGRFDRDVGARAHRDADLGQRQRRRVVHAVARHRDAAPRLREPAHGVRLLLGQRLGHHLVDPELAAPRPAPSCGRPRSASRGAAPRRAARAPPRRSSPSADPRSRAARPRARPARRRPPSFPPRAAPARALRAGPARRRATRCRRGCRAPPRARRRGPRRRVRDAPRSPPPARAGSRAARRPPRSPRRADARSRARGSPRHPEASLPRRLPPATTSTSRGRPSVSVPVLSKTSVSTPRSFSIASALRKSTPAVAPRPIATAIDIGVARPSAQGQAMISTATAFTSACARRGSGPSAAHTRKVAAAASTTTGTNQAATRSARLWIGARLRWACATSATMRASSVSLADLLGPHHEASGAVHAARHDAVPGTLRDRDRLAREHRFVDGARALEHDAVDGQLLPGSHAQRFPDADTRERHVDLAAVLEQAPRGRRREAEQRADRGARAPPRAQLEHLPEQHERHDHGGGLEVDRNAAAVRAEGSRIQAGRERREQAVAPGGSGAERDQREHVELPRPQRAPAAFEERLAAPEHDGRREQRAGSRRAPRPAARGRRGEARASPPSRARRAAA